MSWWEIFIYLWNDKLLHDYWKKFLSDGITTSSSPETSTSAKYTFQQKTNETIIITVIIKAEKRHFSWHKKWATRMKGLYTTELWRKPLKILRYVWLALVRFFQDDVLFKIWFFEWRIWRSWGQYRCMADVLIQIMELRLYILFIIWHLCAFKCIVKKVKK